jgi:hypothetical protein
MNRQLLERLEAASSKVPYLRLGQLLMNSMAVGQDLYYLNDEKLVKAVETYVDKNKSG